MTKILTLLIGLPASGKSTWRSHNAAGSVALSTDDLIEEYAARQGETYNQVFADYIDAATTLFQNKFTAALNADQSIIIDRTNLTPKARDQYVRRARNRGYWIEGIVFRRPMTNLAHNEWNRRLVRPGKIIPLPTLISMFRSFKNPTLEEGFDAINTLDTFKGF